MGSSERWAREIKSLLYSLELSRRRGVNVEKYLLYMMTMKVLGSLRVQEAADFLSVGRSVVF